MSQLHLRHIRSFIESGYASLIDMSDCKKLNEGDRSDKFISRGIALFALSTLSGIEPDVCSKFIVDGFDDNGIDAVYHDQTSNYLYVIQSKYIKAATGGPEQGEMKKFCDGIRDLIAGDFSKFGNKTNKIASTIKMALDDPKTTIKSVIAFTGTQLSAHCYQDIERIKKEVNDPTPYIEFEIMSLSEIHKSLSGMLDANQINFDIMLNEWGATEAPFTAFYGQVNCYELVSIFEKFGYKLFNNNIRKFLGDNAINDAIKQTIINTPDRFFFLNNGITILCENAAKTVMGGSDRKSGTFICSGAQIVNGAQTVGSLAQIIHSHKNQLENARIFARIISIESSNSPISVEITKATNTQNKVEKKDFITLDPNQERIRREFYLENIQYNYKSGDIKEGPESITIDEAISALAVASNNLNYTILAKKEIGKLFEQVDLPPYIHLFNKDTTAIKILRYVQICRRIDSFLEKYKNESGDARHVATHGNRVVQYLAFQLFGKSKTENPSVNINFLQQDKVDLLLNNIIKQRQIKYPDALLSRLFYNQTKTKDVVDSVIETSKHEFE